MIDKGTANSERVTKMHTRHSCKFVDVLAFHPDTLCIVTANRIKESVFFGKKPWWHTRVEDECGKSEEICEGHRSAGNGERVMSWCEVIVPRDKPALVSRSTDLIVIDAYPTVPGICMRAYALFKTVSEP